MTLHHDLTALLHSSVITLHQWRLAEEEMQRGATLDVALTLHGNELAIWAHFAQTSHKPFYREHKELRVYFTDLFGYQLSLKHQLLPHRTRGSELQVLTYNHRKRDGPHPDFPGTQLKHAVISPTVWRFLYNLAYPPSITGRLDEKHATALVTLTPTGSSSCATPQQRAEIIALQRGYRYIDSRRDPPDEDARDLVSLPTKALCQAYPHHLELNRLIVMMVNPDDASALRRLQLQTQLELIPAVTTQGVIDHLIVEDELRLGEQR